MGKKKKKGKKKPDLRWMSIQAVEYATLDDTKWFGMRIWGHDLNSHRDDEVVLVLPVKQGLSFVANIIDLLESNDINVAPLMDRESRSSLSNRIR